MWTDSIFESDICRAERGNDGLWIAEIPMRQIGRSVYKEFRPVALGGHWVRVGGFRTIEDAIACAERFQAGELVYDDAVSRNGETPKKVVRFAAVADEIRNQQ